MDVALAELERRIFHVRTLPNRRSAGKRSAFTHQESDHRPAVHSFRNRTEVPRGWGGWEDGPMRIRERYQLAAELGERYWAAGRRERGGMVDAFCLTTGYSRKYAMSIRRGRQRKPRVVRKPRRRRYGKLSRTTWACYLLET